MNRAELQLAVRPLAYLNAIADSPDGMVELRPGTAPRLLVWHPEVLEEIFRSDRRLAHPGSRSLTPLLGPGSLLWADGERHAAYRRVLGPALRGRALTGHREIIAGHLRAAIDELRPGTVVPLAAWTRKLALRIIGRIVLGAPEPGMLAEFGGWLRRAFGSRTRGLAYRFLGVRLPRSGPDLDRALVRAARAGHDDGQATLAALLLSGDGPIGELGEAELRDQIVSLLFAGHETTATAMTWTLLWLDRDRRLREAVLAELADADADGSDATRTPLLQAVIQEVLRLTPSTAIGENRMLTEETELGGRRFPAGTVCTLSIYLAHRRPEAFAAPRRFDPGRFLGTRPPRHYFPFGGGTRRCLGSGLAQLEIRMLVAELLRRRHWHCVNPGAGRVRIRGNLLTPDPALRMRVTGDRG
ncbi:cytochrome P450 [Amycolatopsis aidingensis]|uniref:cytochrome P450 n=1 Tax=Amycolatopsis aidingensis TaxID=2842453 RepID=UPI001C0D4079|nr:cytochrome P450 [Amycolatopsis aidingensis]